MTKWMIFLTILHDMIIFMFIALCAYDAFSFGVLFFLAMIYMKILNVVEELKSIKSKGN